MAETGAPPPFVRRGGDRRRQGVRRGGRDQLGELGGQRQGVAGAGVEPAAAIAALHDGGAGGSRSTGWEILRGLGHRHRQHAALGALDPERFPAVLPEPVGDPAPAFVLVQLGAVGEGGVFDQRPRGGEGQDVHEPVAVALRDRGVHHDRTGQTVPAPQGDLLTVELLKAARYGRAAGAARVDHGPRRKRSTVRQPHGAGVRNARTGVCSHAIEPARSATMRRTSERRRSLEIIAYGVSSTRR